MHIDPGFAAPSVCPGNNTWQGLNLLNQGVATQGGTAYWQVNAPPGISIVGAYVPEYQMSTYGVNGGTGYGGGFYWQGGGSPISEGNQTQFSASFKPSSWFRIQLTCGHVGHCTPVNSGPARIRIQEIELVASESRGPGLTAIGSGNLWYQPGWVRGSGWPISFQATDPSGVCSTEAIVNGQVIPGPGATARNNAWHQCPDQNWNVSIDTSRYGQGAIPLALEASNAAYDYGAHAPVSSVASKTIYVDNIPPTIALSGPTDAPATAGVQYLTATAAAGPSGVSGVACSVDGQTPHMFPGPSVRVGIGGVGVHHLGCVAYNGARDPAGAPGSSALETWTLSIREPSVALVAFSSSALKVRCRKVRVKVRVPGQWVTVRVHGQPVRVRVPAQTRVRIVLRCQGRSRSPAAQSTSSRAKFGSASAVKGWLGTAGGQAIGGARVRILAAPDNGVGMFHQVAEAITAADGMWLARLPAGPSRLIVAAYAGSAIVEPTLSSPVHLKVPASLGLNIAPRSTHWGGTITISGRLRGGYVPPAGELVVLHVGWPGGSTEIGHVYAGHDGRFSTRYTFLRGNGSETYRLWASTASESDYPYAPSNSRQVSVSVG